MQQKSVIVLCKHASSSHKCIYPLRIFFFLLAPEFVGVQTVTISAMSKIIVAGS